LLVSKLCEIPVSKYVPKLEKICLEPCRGEGIWDVLGYYNRELEIVFICEVEIQEEVKKLSTIRELIEKLKVPEGHVSNYLTLIVRELVRLHEHAHAYLHTAIIETSEGCVGRTVELDWWKCREVNEPLAEFVARSIVEKFGDPFVTVFEEVDKSSPLYYRRWKDIERICKLSPSAIPPLTRIFRSKAWSNWNEFYQELKRKKDSIIAEVACYSLIY